MMAKMGGGDGWRGDGGWLKGGGSQKEGKRVCQQLQARVGYF